MSDKMHVAICQAVGIINQFPELGKFSEGRQISQILRTALFEYKEPAHTMIAVDRERLAELEANAARYLWLRGQNWSDSKLFVVAGGKTRIVLGTVCPTGSWLDEAIDAAKKGAA